MSEFEIEPPYELKEVCRKAGHVKIDRDTSFTQVGKFFEQFLGKHVEIDIYIDDVVSLHLFSDVIKSVSAYEDEISDEDEVELELKERTIQFIRKKDGKFEIIINDKERGDTDYFYGYPSVSIREKGVYP